MTGKNDTSEDDADLFRRAMVGVNRDHSNYGQERHISDAPKPPVKIRRHADTGEETPRSIGTLSDDAFTRGVQKNTLRALKRGQVPFTATLDLHGYTLADAEVALPRFIAKAITAGDSCVLIIHGKGLRSSQSGGVLKPFTQDWLAQQKAVKAFCPAQPKHGGSGALYVLVQTRKAAGGRD